ncbi:MAG: ArnT family glycosyltransferase [Thermoleophilia bacterium]
MKKLRGITVNRTLVLIILLALAVRVIVALSRQSIYGDEFAYSRLAEELAAGNGFTDMLGRANTIFFPLLPILIAFVSFFISDIVVAGYVVEILFGCLLLIPAYLLGRELAGERAGILTAALLAVLPLAVEYSTRIYTETVYTFFLLMFAYLFWRILHGAPLYHAPLAGAMIGLAYLVNPSAVFYVGAFLALTIVAAVRAGSARAHFIKAATVFLVVFLALAFPYVVYLHGHLGKWTYSGKSSADTIYAASQGIRWFTPEYEKMLSELNADGTDIVDTSEWDDGDPVSFFIKHPRLFTRILLQNLDIFYTEQSMNVIPLWLLPLLGLGLFGAAWDRSRWQAIAFSLMLMAPVMLIFAIEYRPRFFLPYVPLVIIWVALGWQRLEEWGRKTFAAFNGEARRGLYERLAPVGIALAVMLPLLMATTVYASKYEYNTGLKGVGVWIRDNGGAGGNIMDRELGAAFYADGTAVLFPYADYRETTDYARLKDVDFLVISRGALLDFRPGMKVLLEEESRHPDWRLVHRVQSGGDDELLVFELLK